LNHQRRTTLRNPISQSHAWKTSSAIGAVLEFGMKENAAGKTPEPLVPNATGAGSMTQPEAMRGESPHGSPNSIAGMLRRKV
jgi:hypothetical protein